MSVEPFLKLSNPKAYSFMHTTNNRSAQGRIREVLFFIVLLALAIYADQYSKQLAVRLLEGTAGKGYLNNIVHFTLVENTGGFLGVVSNYPEKIQFFLLYIGVSVLLGFCLFFIFWKKDTRKRYTVPLTFVTAGGTGNLLDRICNNGGVIDFVSVGIGPIRTGIFNLADVLILTGSFLLGYLFLTQNSHTTSSSN